MTHVSKKRLEKDVYYTIMSGLYWLLSDINTENAMRQFLQDFFTKTEQLMLAKRLAVALLIMQGYDAKVITQVLKVSTNTVYRTKDWVEQGGEGLQFGLHRLAHQEKMNSFWKRINNFLEDIIEPRMFPFERIRSKD